MQTEYQARYYRENRERILSRNRVHDKSHKADRVRISQRYRMRHLAKVTEYQKEYVRKNAARYAAHAAKRRALKKAAAINEDQILRWMVHVSARKTAVCYYCGKRVPISKVHFDHIVPLSKGGAHSVENLCIACQHCNQTKSDRPLRFWIRVGQQHLEL